MHAAAIRKKSHRFLRSRLKADRNANSQVEVTYAWTSVRLLEAAEVLWASALRQSTRNGLLIGTNVQIVGFYVLRLWSPDFYEASATHLDVNLMSDLVRTLLDAHGGLGRWKERESVAATLRQGGVLWALKDQAGVLDETRVMVSLKEGHVSHEPFGPQRARADQRVARSFVGLPRVTAAGVGNPLS